MTFTADGHEPDGIWISSDGTIACTAGEYDGKIGIVDLTTIDQESHHNITLISQMIFQIVGVGQMREKE